MRIRLAAAGDAEAIRAIYNPEVTTDVNTFDLVPRTPADQRPVARRPTGGPTRRWWPTEGPAGAETVVGFGSLSPYRDRPAYATTVENSVYVDPAQRGRGVGRAILGELVDLAPCTASTR